MFDISGYILNLLNNAAFDNSEYIGSDSNKYNNSSFQKFIGHLLFIFFCIKKLLYAEFVTL